MIVRLRRADPGHFAVVSSCRCGSSVCTKLQPSNHFEVVFRSGPTSNLRPPFRRSLAVPVRGCRHGWLCYETPVCDGRWGPDDSFRLAREPERQMLAPETQKAPAHGTIRLPDPSDTLAPAQATRQPACLKRYRASRSSGHANRVEKSGGSGP